MDKGRDGEKDTPARSEEPELLHVILCTLQMFCPPRLNRQKPPTNLRIASSKGLVLQLHGYLFHALRPGQEGFQPVRYLRLQLLALLHAYGGVP